MKDQKRVISITMLYKSTSQANSFSKYHNRSCKKIPSCVAAVPYVQVIRLFTAIKESNCEKPRKLEKYSLVMVLMMSVFQSLFRYHSLTQTIFKMN